MVEGRFCGKLAWQAKPLETEGVQNGGRGLVELGVSKPRVEMVIRHLYVCRSFDVGRVLMYEQNIRVRALPYLVYTESAVYCLADGSYAASLRIGAKRATPD